MPSILFITRGCAKNEVDTDRMRALLLGAGYDETGRPRIRLTRAYRESAPFVRLLMSRSIPPSRLRSRRGRGSHPPHRYVRSRSVSHACPLANELPEVSAFVNADDEDGIVDVVDGAGLERDVAPGVSPRRAGCTVDGASAYVKIPEGCTGSCAFLCHSVHSWRYAPRCERDL